MKKILLLLLLIPILSFSQIHIGYTEDEIEKAWDLELTQNDLSDGKTFIAVTQEQYGFIFSYVFDDISGECVEVFLIASNKDWVAECIEIYNRDHLELERNLWLVSREDSNFMKVQLTRTSDNEYLFRFY